MGEPYESLVFRNKQLTYLLKYKYTSIFKCITYKISTIFIFYLPRHLIYIKKGLRIYYIILLSFLLPLLRFLLRINYYGYKPVAYFF